MADTKDYRELKGPATMCMKYHVVRGRVIAKEGTIDGECEETDKYHIGFCRHFDPNSKVCRNASILPKV